MPPQAGFVSEWYMFETVFQGFRLDTLASRLVMALAGAGLALTVAIAFATYVKVFGIGLLGRTARRFAPVGTACGLAVGLLGAGVLALAVGMPVWLDALQGAVSAQFGTMAARNMHDGLLLVPLTAKFAFISPTLLVVVMPLLAIVPVVLVVANRRYAVRRVPVWYGGFDQDPARASTTALTFSNALRTFYSFVYRPKEETTREVNLPVFRPSPGLHPRRRADLRALSVCAGNARGLRPGGQVQGAAVRPAQFLFGAYWDLTGRHSSACVVLNGVTRRHRRPISGLVDKKDGREIACGGVFRRERRPWSHAQP